MSESEPKPRESRSLRAHLLSGLLVMVPLWITYVVVTTVFQTMASVLKPLIRLLPWALSDTAVFVLSVLAFILVLLVVGMVASWVVGRRMLRWGESLILKIPMIKTIYAAAKQVMDAISLPNKKAFKSVVLIEYPRVGLRTLAFVTGLTTTQDGRVCCRVFVPTTPNPTGGFLLFVPVEDVLVTDITVELALKIIISGGFIAPDKLATRPFTQGDA